MILAYKSKVPSMRFEGFTDAWKHYKLEDVSDIVRGASPRPIKDPKWFDKESEVGWLRISDVTEQDGRIKFLVQRISEAGQEKTRVLNEPHLLLSIAATVGKPVINYVETGVHDGFLIFLNPKFEQEFMFQWFIMFRPKWQQFGQPGSQVNLNSGLVKNTKIMLPNREEQVKIGDFLKAIDKSITGHQRKLLKYKNVKKAMLEKMFPKNGRDIPDIRFSGFTDVWEKRKVSELLQERNFQAPKNQEYPLMAFVAYEGITPKGDRYNREFLVSDGVSKKYKRTEFGDFIYSSNNLTTGSIGLNKYGNASISPVYSIFHPTEIADADFIGCSFIRQEFINKMIKWRQGVIYGQWRIHESDFLEIETYVPSIKEQKKIGNFFDELDNLITLHQRKIEKLKNLKKAFLERMFV